MYRYLSNRYLLVNSSADNFYTQNRQNESCSCRLRVVSIGCRDSVWNRHVGSFRTPANIDTGLSENPRSPHISPRRQYTIYPRNLLFTTGSMEIHSTQEIVRTNSDIPKRDAVTERQTNRQTDKQTTDKNSTFLVALAEGEIRAPSNLVRW